MNAIGLHFLFAAGNRPNRAAIRSFADEHRTISLTHDPHDDNPLHLVATDGENVGQANAATSTVRDTQWVELLSNGLTFDLAGLAPGEPCALPEIEHQFDQEGSPAAMRLESLHLIPGRHLSVGVSSAPVLRSLVALARDIVHYFDAIEAVVWEPASSVIGRRYFESVTTAWLDGGPFPALGLTAFKQTMDGGLQSVGLKFLIGQELQIEPPLSNNKIEATRLGVRLINQLVVLGRLTGLEHVIAPDGNQLTMRPSANGNFIRVTRE